MLQVVTSTTSRTCPSDLAAHQSIGQYVQATGQSAQAAALHRTIPTSPIISLRLACADADRCECERPCDSCSRGDPLQFHRELLYQLAVPPLRRKAACHKLAKTARRSRLFRDVYIVPPAAFVSHYRSAATLFACAASLFEQRNAIAALNSDYAAGAVTTRMTSRSGSGDVGISRPNSPQAITSLAADALSGRKRVTDPQKYCPAPPSRPLPDRMRRVAEPACQVAAPFPSRMRQPRSPWPGPTLRPVRARRLAR